MKSSFCFSFVMACFVSVTAAQAGEGYYYNAPSYQAVPPYQVYYGPAIAPVGYYAPAPVAIAPVVPAPVVVAPVLPAPVYVAPVPTVRYYSSSYRYAPFGRTVERVRVTPYSVRHSYRSSLGGYGVYRWTY